MHPAFSRFACAFAALATPFAATLAPAQPRTSAAEPEPAALHVQASRTLLKRFVSQRIDQTEPYTDVIDEVPVEGMRRAIAVGDVEFVPDRSRAVVDVILNGASSSWEIGRRQFVLLHTVTTTSFQTRQRIVVDARSLTGARGSCDAHACITLVKTTDRFGDPDAAGARLARLGFVHERARLEGIVSAKAARQAAEQHEANLIPSLEDASRLIGASLSHARAAGLPTESLHFSSTAQHLRVRLGGPSGADVRAAALPAHGDVAAAVPDALINAAARRLLSGKTVSATQLLAATRDWPAYFLGDGRKAQDQTEGLKQIDKLLKSLPEEPGVTFAKDDPLTVRFTAADAALAVHFASIGLGVGGQRLADVRLRAVYRFEHGEQGPAAVRQGPVLIEMDDKMNPALPGLALLLRPVADEVFKPRFRLNPLPVPVPADGVPSLSPARWETSAGWMTLVWNLPDSKTR